MRKTIGFGVLAITGLAAAALAGVGLPEQARGEASGGRTITVTGEGLVEAKPDEAAFSFGVSSRAETAREAMAANATAVRRLIEAVKAAGVGEDDLQTEHVSVWPEGKPNAGVSGYTASATVRVVTRVAEAGRTVDVAMRAGATNVWGPSLTRGDTDELEERALDRAVRDARRKAAALAEAAGATLGDVVKIVEGGAAEPEYGELAARATADTNTPNTPIAPGRVETRASVTVTFAMS